VAGTVISTAVLTGALVVGDSVRYSLGQLTDLRMGKARYAIQSGDRFFSQQLATDLAKQTKSPSAALLQLEGIAINNDQNSRINRVEVFGIDENFLKFWEVSLQLPGEDEAILNQNTAERLKLKTGDEFLLKIHKQAKASENAPFVSEKEPLVTFRLKVKAIANDSEMGRFSLKNNQAAPFNIFLSISNLAHKSKLEGQANLLLVAENKQENLSSQKLDSLVQWCWKPEDAGLEIAKLPDSTTFEIRSSRIFIDDNTAKAIESSIPGVKPIFTYLVNSISTKTHATPYSFVTALNLQNQQLSDHEIIISNWLASDLDVKPGDSLQLKYFKMGSMRKLTEDSARFCIKYILPISDPLFDRTLMPDFPGMSDAGNCRDWETGAPVDLSKIRDKDEQYWNDFRGTPKAFISLVAGQQLWDNAFGHATAFRFNAENIDLKQAKIQLMKNLNPGETGLKFQDVYEQGKAAAAHSTDFGSLFLSLSFFIIAAALLLIALLFSLHAQKRMSETAILSTIGFRKKDIIRILFTEASFVLVFGSFLGVICGIFYNKFLLLGLNTLWQDAVRTSMLEMHLRSETLFIGFASGVITAFVTVLFVLLRNLRKPLSVMVKGVEIQKPEVSHRRKKISYAIAVSLLLTAAALLVYSIFSSLSDLSEIFLSAGGIIMAGGIIFLYATLLKAGLKTSISFPGFFAMILKNAGMKKRRTVTAVAMLAIGTFSIIITGANRKSFYGTENNPQSGTGGFLFWAESTVPVLNDLNSAQGKQKYGLTDESELQNVHFEQLLRLDGNDASCLNLNQVSQPKILGINPLPFNQHQSFSFISLDKSVDAGHPWLALEKGLSPGVIPAYADQTVIQWGMHKKVGDTLLYTDESGKILKIKIIGGLDNSIFQGNILISAGLFRQYFPSTAGSHVMLIEGKFSDRSAISERLEYLFQDYGMMITPASERLAQFNSVENTYLSVFMLLGGLGVILGTFGLGIIVIRNIRERQKEIAIYLAIGYKRKFIFRLLAAEYLFILVSGIFIGTISALTGLLPSIVNSSSPLPWSYIIAILLVVLLNGLFWIVVPIKSALKKNIVISLRSE
jgi:ABC-type antimicrobial peptide transport system permease subunit